jgi:DNA polymerase-1
MIKTDQWLLEDKPDAKMIMQVHDELVFEVAENHVESCSALIRNIMSSAADLNVPLLVDIGVGNNWDEAH